MNANVATLEQLEVALTRIFSLEDPTPDLIVKEQVWICMHCKAGGIEVEAGIKHLERAHGIATQ